MVVYKNTVEGRFVDRPNRFIAHVEIEGILTTVHVKNTGRCRELLLPGAKVILAAADNPNRKTKYDLIAVYKAGFGLINMDSQAPNRVVAEWLREQDYDVIRPEYKYGRSRLDFYMEKHVGAVKSGGGEEKEDGSSGRVERYLMEVKGCTLEREGTGYFPDAPTQRGVRHLAELAEAVGQGYHCIMAYVIQMEGVNEVRPNVITHPEYGRAVEEAMAAGVRFLYLCTEVKENELRIVSGRYAD